MGDSKTDNKYLTSNKKFILSSLLVIVVPFSIFIISQLHEQKSFSYEIISSIPLLSIKENYEPSKFYIKYLDLTLKDPFYTLIKIHNTGKVPVKTSDFESPISIVYEPDVKIYDYSVSDKDPKSIDVSLIQKDNMIIISPTLFNPSDYITLQILSSKVTTPPKVNTRIIGIKSVDQKLNAPYDFYKKYFYIMIIFGNLLLFMYFSTPFLSQKMKEELINKSKYEISSWVVISGLSSCYMIVIGMKLLQMSINDFFIYEIPIIVTIFLIATIIKIKEGKKIHQLPHE